MLSAIYSTKRHNEDGFTLLELLIVVIVIGILAAIALPIFLNQQRAAVDASVQSDVRNSVAQLIGAQATKDASFKATVSRTDTTLTLTDATDSTKNGSAVGSATNPTLSTPASGDEFTLSGSNPAGGKFQGASVTGGKTFTYDGKTGKFSDGTAANTGSTGGSASSGSDADAVTNANTLRVDFEGGEDYNRFPYINYNYTTEQHHGGARSGSTTYSGAVSGRAFVVVDDAMVPNEKYAISGWMLAPDANDTDVLTGFFPGIGASDTDVKVKSATWKHFNTVITAPATLNLKQIYIKGTSSTGGASNLYLDDIIFTPLG